VVLMGLQLAPGIKLKSEGSIGAGEGPAWHPSVSVR
jgi:hypothetical protein